MLVWLAVLSFVVFSGLAATRLFLLWRRTRQLPELLISILIFGVGTVAVGGGFLINRLIAQGPILDAARFLPTFGAGVGMIALCVFTWHPENSQARFRPSRRRVNSVLPTTKPPKIVCFAIDCVDPHHQSKLDHSAASNHEPNRPGRGRTYVLCQ